LRSNPGSRPIYTERAIALGDRLARDDSPSSMAVQRRPDGVVADAVLAAGGEVIG